MTPREMLAPQAAPLTGRISVVDWLLTMPGMPSIVAELLVARREQGLEWYGTELKSHNGRCAAGDRLQEAVDGLKYSAQQQIELGGPVSALSYDATQLMQLASALERVPPWPAAASSKTTEAQLRAELARANDELEEWRSGRRSLPRWDLEP